MEFNIGETFEVFMAVAILTVAMVMVISPPNYLHHINKDPTLLWYHLRRADVVQSNRKRQKYFAGHTLSFVANLCFLDPTPYLANFPKFCHFLTPSLISCILQSWLNLRRFWLFTSGTSYVELNKLARCLCQLLSCLLRSGAGVFDKKCLDL